VTYKRNFLELLEMILNQKLGIKTQFIIRGFKMNHFLRFLCYLPSSIYWSITRFAKQNDAFFFQTFIFMRSIECIFIKI